MGLIRRVSDLVRANLNDFIDKAEDPVKAVRQLIHRLDDKILTMRGRLRKCSGRIDSMKSRMDEKRAEIALWQERAEKAVDENDEPGARCALLRKRSLEGEAGELEKSWWKACREKEESEKELTELENRAQEARRQKETLLAKKGTDPVSHALRRVTPPPFNQDEKDFEQKEIEKELQNLIRSRRGGAG